MKRRLAFRMVPSAPIFTVAAIAAVAMLTTAGCTKEEGQRPPGAPAPVAAAPAKKGPTPVNEAELARIPILPGYKYYIGGPFLDADKYGKARIKKFNGEVAQPPSRGMVFGAKVDGDKMEYRVWGNGVLLGFHRGTMRDGLYWDEYVEAFKNGKMVARENITYDDEAKRAKIVTEDIDPENGEVIRTKEMPRSYYPPADPKDEDGEDEDEDETPPGEQPAGKAPAAAPAAPAAPTPGAAK